MGSITNCTTAQGWDLLLPQKNASRGPAPGIEVHFTIETRSKSPSASSTERWLVHKRKVGTTTWDPAIDFPPGLSSMDVVSLESDAAYEIFLSTSHRHRHPQTPQQTPIVIYRTLPQATSFFEVFRISERCGDACQPDMLDEHDSGDLLADVSFITHVAASGHHSFNISFNHSIVTRYCIERAVPPARDWADYLSCNGDYTTDYSCACNNWIDRCIGRLDISPCDLHNATGHMPVCHCSDASLQRSAMEIGRMPVYSPFPNFNSPGWNCTASSPSANESSFLGYWYSTPTKAACAPGTTPTGTTGHHHECSWSRRPSQHYVVGADLYALGFNTSDAADLDELKHNRDVLEAAFARHPGRCCGC